MDKKCFFAKTFPLVVIFLAALIIATCVCVLLFACVRFTVSRWRCCLSTKYGLKTIFLVLREYMSLDEMIMRGYGDRELLILSTKFYRQFLAI